MSRTQNPYSEFLIDEVSGIKVLNVRHQIWNEGYKARQKSSQAIKTIIRCQNDMVMVFDKEREQIPEYQGQYEEVKESILKNAPSGAIFSHLPDYETEVQIVSRNDW